jgi:hypothetical protein
MPMKGRTARPAVSKPKSPAEARAWLRSLSKQIKKHLADYEAHETLADAQHLRWFAGAAAAYLSKKKKPKEKKKSLEQLLGLKAGPGRPSKPGRHFDLACEMFLLRSTKSPTRKSKKGESTPRPWKEVGKAYDLDGKSARKIVERELPNIVAALAKKLAARRRLRLKKPPRVEVVRFNSPQNARHFAGDLAVRFEREIVILFPSADERRRTQALQ